MSESPRDNLTFEDALVGLEQIVRDLEDGQVGLEDALELYERGIGLLKRCYAQLREAEQKVLLLTGMDAGGQPVAQPFEPAAVSASRPDAAKKRKKVDDEPGAPF